MLRVIGAGFARTGTLSMKAALEQLGFGPCHHMEEVFRHPSEVRPWERAARGKPVDWKQLMAPYGACVDFPGALHWRALLEAFPEARVVLTVRDPEAWFESLKSTIRALWRPLPSRLVARHLPFVGAPFRVTQPHSIGRAVIRGSKAQAIAAFLEHNATVRREVPEDQLLVFEVRDGWEPLCEFLRVPVPEGPFPHRNDRLAFVRRAVGVAALSTLALSTPPVMLAVGAWIGARTVRDALER